MSNTSGYYAPTVKRRYLKTFIQWSKPVLAFSEKAFDLMGRPHHVQIAGNLLEKTIYVRPMLPGKGGWMKTKEFDKVNNTPMAHWTETEIRAQNGRYSFEGKSGDAYKFVYKHRL